MERIKTIILGAAGRDYHNFLTYFKDNPNYEVVAFTTAQILEKHREFPRELTGKLYKKDIPIHPESELPELIKKFNVDYVFLAYSDLPEREFVEKASIVLSTGSNFALLGPKDTMLKSKKKLIAVCATRTGAGKGTVCRKILDILKSKKPVLIRHPMAYGYLREQTVQRFVSYEDLKKYDTTYEEQEEYVPYLEKGFVVYSGIDYKKILQQAEKESDMIVFESGNNDISLFKPDLYITVADPTRPEGIYSYPGEANLRLSDVIVINKVNIVNKAVTKNLESAIKKINNKAIIIKAKSIVKVDKPELVKNKSVVLIDDAPTITHGGLKESVSAFVARKYNAKIISPHKYAVGTIKKVLGEYPYLNSIPTIGYSKKQKEDFIKSVNNVKCNTILFGSYAYLGYMRFNKPVARITYDLEEITKSDLKTILSRFRRIN